MIPAHAAADYEALREQLFGIKYPCKHATGLSVLVRHGLAAWACRRPDPIPPTQPASASPIKSSDHEDITTGFTLAKLIANLILSTRQEIAPCRT